MALVALNHRKGTGVVPIANTVTSILDAVYTALTAAADYTAVNFPSPLVGVTKFVTAGVLTEAIYGTFTTSAKTFKFLIAGSATAKTPLMGGSHTWAANCILSGGTLNAGAFATWDSATFPFTSGPSTGLTRTFDTALFTIAKVYAVITAETLHLYYESNTGTIFGSAFGALIDPHSTGGNSAESDGRVYGVAVSGSTAAMFSGMHATSASVGSYLRYTASASREHFIFFVPGAVMSRASRNDGRTSSTTTTDASADNEPYAWPIVIYDPLTGKGVGRLREVCLTRDAKYGQKQAPTTDVWYYVSGSTGTDMDAIALLY